METPGEDICDVCGRTMLRGERTEPYLDGEGAEQAVCVLCRPRAEHHGWIRKAMASETLIHGHGRDRRRRRSFLVGRRRRPPAEAAPTGPGAAGPSSGSPGAPEAERPRRESGDPSRNPGQRAEESPVEAASDASPNGEAPGRSGLARIAQAAARRSPRPVRAVPSDAEARFDLALDLFNDSEHVRTVSSISRSLGPPDVSVGALSGSPGDVRITVCWDLSWYQWTVDLTEPDEPVRMLAKGAEADELDAPARQWNSHVGDDGKLARGLVS